MIKSISKYTLSINKNLVEALQKINNNKKGFLIILDDNIVKGTITDGDIRRFILKENILNSPIKKVFKTNFKYININDDFKTIINIFKEDKIKFLPILNDKKELINIITKSNLHTLLLQDIPYNPFYDFCSLDNITLDYEIFSRPWGFYKTTFLNEFYQSKIISVNPKSSLSLQKHLRREEHWIIIKGEGIGIIDEKKIYLKPGTHLHIPKNTKHRLINTSKTDRLIITEVQLGDYFGEDDIIRFEDEYGRH